MTKSRFLIALGSNQRHIRYGLPPAILTAAIAALNKQKLTVLKQSSTINSLPIGPSKRRYANGAAILESAHDPIDMLSALKSIEATFGQRRGQIWSRRVLDLDILLWSQGVFSSDRPALVIPHAEMKYRPFVLRPAAEIAPDWRDPVTGLTIRQLAYRNSQN